MIRLYRYSYQVNKYIHTLDHLESIFSSQCLAQLLRKCDETSKRKLLSLPKSWMTSLYGNSYSTSYCPYHPILTLGYCQCTTWVGYIFPEWSIRCDAHLFDPSLCLQPENFVLYNNNKK